MNDLEKSEKIVADILAKLLGHGLRRVDLSPEDFEYQDKADRELFGDCMLWLDREGMIDAKHRDKAGGFSRVSLTAFGFSILGNRGPFPDEDITVGEMAKKVHAGEAQYARLGNFFGGLLGSLIKSIG